MSSYGSNKSGFLHPQYQPQPPAPPYPTTPGPTSNGTQQSPFYPPTPQPQHAYSSSPTSHNAMPMPMPEHRRRSSSSSSYNAPTQRRRSSSYSYSARPSMAGMPIPIRQPSATTYAPSSSYPPQPPSQPQLQAQSYHPTYAQHPPPLYARSNSHHSAHMWDPHAYADGEDKLEHSGYEQQFERIDEATEREYEKRYAREKRERRELENRPTLGGSLLSMGRKVGRAFGSERS